jgi:N-acetylmuramoyl-L-alanine amidase
LYSSRPFEAKPGMRRTAGVAAHPKAVRPAVLRLSILALLIASGIPLLAVDKRDRADAAYQAALSLQSALESRAPALRSPKDYEKVVRAFDLVYRTDPSYPKTPAAIAAEAATYEEMGKAFASDRYYESAVATCQFLIDQYPWGSLARDALFTIAEIYRVDLENPEDAATAYSQFLKKYPTAAKAEEARAQLEQINRRKASARAETAPTKRVDVSADTPSSSPAQASPSGGLSEVSSVRFWQGSDYTRIVVSVMDEVKFDAARLSHPDRIIFDLAGTHLSRSLVGKSFPVGNGFLQQIRVAQFRPDVTRVVLDIGDIGDYSVFSLPNPFRLIIDVHGPQQPPSVVAHAEGGPPSTTIATPATPVATDPSSSRADRISTVPGTRQAPGSRASAPEKSISVLSDATQARDVSPAPIASPPTSAPGQKDSLAPATSASEPKLIPPPASTSPGSTTLTRALGLKISRIVIDPGHGGHDTGTVGPTGLEEKAVVLDVALRLQKLIEQRMGSSVVMTRTDDTFIPLEERTAIANQQGADLFISVHANASRDASARGIEVYYLNFTSDTNSLEVAARENATSQESVHQLQNLIKKIALSEKIEESSEFAQQVDRSLSGATAGSGNRQPNRGLKKAPFVVLIGADMPSILAEISFLTNPRDEKLLRQARYRQKIAEGLYRGVAGYVSNMSGVKIAEQSPDLLPAVRTRQHARLAASPAAPPLAADPADQ